MKNLIIYGRKSVKYVQENVTQVFVKKLRTYASNVCILLKKEKKLDIDFPCLITKLVDMIQATKDQDTMGRDYPVTII